MCKVQLAMGQAAAATAALDEAERAYRAAGDRWNHEKAQGVRIRILEAAGRLDDAARLAEELHARAAYSGQTERSFRGS
jgi:hypothetical protein